MKTLAPIVVLLGLTWWQLWFTPDQQGQRLLDRGELQAAAATFRDPMRQGIAWYRAAEFEKAEQAFARVTTPEAYYNRGNCLVMRGKYEQAIERFDLALKSRPNWQAAKINRDIAVARAKMLEKKGGDMTGGELEPDEIVFEKGKKNNGQETQTEGDKPLSDAALQALWLRRVQTKPADFLRRKFAYQLTETDAGDPGE